MGLVNFLILLVLIGGGLYLLELAPINGTIKRVIQVVVVIVVIILAIRFLVPMAGLG